MRKLFYCTGIIALFGLTCLPNLAVQPQGASVRPSSPGDGRTFRTTLCLAPARPAKETAPEEPKAAAEPDLRGEWTGFGGGGNVTIRQRESQLAIARDGKQIGYGEILPSGSILLRFGIPISDGNDWHYVALVRLVNKNHLEGCYGLECDVKIVDDEMTGGASCSWPRPGHCYDDNDGCDSPCLFLIEPEPIKPPKNAKPEPRDIELKEGWYASKVVQGEHVSHGAATIRKINEQFVLRWLADGGKATGTAIGTGIRHGDTLSVASGRSDSICITVFKIGADGVLTGKWAIWPTDDGMQRKETLTWEKAFAKDKD